MRLGMDQRLLFGRAFAVVAMSAVATLAACGGGGKARQTGVAKAPVARGGGPISLVTAVDTISKERCTREARCNRIGPGRPYVSADACRDAIGHEERSSLRTTVCESGYVEPDALAECISAVRASGCTTDATAACEPSSMCSL